MWETMPKDLLVEILGSLITIFGIERLLRWRQHQQERARRNIALADLLNTCSLASDGFFRQLAEKSPGEQDRCVFCFGDEQVWAISISEVEKGYLKVQDTFRDAATGVYEGLSQVPKLSQPDSFSTKFRAALGLDRDLFPEEILRLLRRAVVDIDLVSTGSEAADPLFSFSALDSVLLLQIALEKLATRGPRLADYRVESKKRVDELQAMTDQMLEADQRRTS